MIKKKGPFFFANISPDSTLPKLSNPGRIMKLLARNASNAEKDMGAIKYPIFKYWNQVTLFGFIRIEDEGLAGDQISNWTQIYQSKKWETIWKCILWNQNSLICSGPVTAEIFKKKAWKPYNFKIENKVCISNRMVVPQNKQSFFGVGVILRKYVLKLLQRKALCNKAVSRNNNKFCTPHLRLVKLIYSKKLVTF